MAGAGLSIVRRIRSLLGSEAVVDTDATGLPRVAPRRDHGVAVVLRTATHEGWKVRVEGRGGWAPSDAPADLALSTRQLTRLTHTDPGDLVASVEAGLPWHELRAELAEHGTWVAVDPPGEGRSVGSVVATGAAGPLRGGFGNVRDHLLGLTLVTGDGRIGRPGGRVVKNVAGFDLTKLAAGSFGAFGVITAVNFRLRAVPRADVTLVATGMRDALLETGRRILAHGLSPASLELISPRVTEGDQWTLAVRLLGASEPVRAERDAVRGATAEIGLRALPADQAGEFWAAALAAAVDGEITLRLGALPSALDDALDLLAHHLPEGPLTVSIGAGAVRWTGAAAVDRLRLLRHAAAQQEMPLTLERAPWDVRRQLGHFGAYREGVGQLIDRLARTFDPGRILVTGVDPEPA